MTPKVYLRTSLSEVNRDVRNLKLFVQLTNKVTKTYPALSL